MDWYFIQGGVLILLVTSWYRNWKKLLVGTETGSDKTQKRKGEPKRRKKKSLPFSYKLVKQSKQLRGIFHWTHAIPRHLTIVSVVDTIIAIICKMTSPFLGKYVPDVDTEGVMQFQNVNTADVLFKKRKRNGRNLTIYCRLEYSKALLTWWLLHEKVTTFAHKPKSDTYWKNLTAT